VQVSIDVDRLQGVVSRSRRQSNPVEKVRLSVEHGLARGVACARGQHIGKI
jgi:hypothetical protein